MFDGLTSRWTSPRSWARSSALATWVSRSIACAADRGPCRNRRPQVGSFDVAHRDEQVTVGLARLVDRNDVRMVDRRCQFGLGQESLPKGSAGGEGRGQDLQRDLALEAEILAQGTPRPSHRVRAASLPDSGECVGVGPRLTYTSGFRCRRPEPGRGGEKWRKPSLPGRPPMGSETPPRGDGTPSKPGTIGVEPARRESNRGPVARTNLTSSTSSTDRVTSRTGPTPRCRKGLTWDWTNPGGTRAAASRAPSRDPALSARSGARRSARR